MDSTSDQTAPLDRLRGVKESVFSPDLRSAIDRCLLLMSVERMIVLFDRISISSVVNSALGTNIFDVAFVNKRRVVCLVTG